MTDDTSGGALAGRIRDLRRERSWSQEHLADAAGVSLRTVQRVENGAPCAFETVQALAAAFGVAPGALSGLLGASRRNGAPPRRFGLSPRAAALAGAALSLPAVLFIASNVGFYEFGQSWARLLFPTGPLGGVLSHPAVLLGGPLLALGLNLAHLVGLKRRAVPRGALVEGVYVSLRPGPIVTLGLGAACLGVLVGYAVLENLGHMIADIAG